MSEDNNYRFSIIVPIYNIGEYLPKCLDSILNQTFSNFELILVDDGSKDSSHFICDEYEKKDSRIKVIHKGNGGLVSARQVGSNKAVGEYIACVDGDDWIEPNYLNAFNEQIENHHPDMVCCGYIKSMSDNDIMMPMPNRIGYYSREQMEKEIFPLLIQSEYATYFRPSLWAKAIKREIQQQQQLVDCVVNIGEDGACVIPCIYHSNSLVVIEDCLYHYCINDSSMTKNRKAFRWDGPQLIGEHIQRQIDMGDLDFADQLNRKICHEVFTVVTSHLFQQKKYVDLKKDVMEGLSNPYYEKAIANAKFSSMKARFMQHCLNHKLIAVMWLYSKFKQF